MRLSLYYHWALQTLSALRFVHSHSVYLSDFCTQTVWPGSDFSVAITGFLSATLPTDNEE